MLSVFLWIVLIFLILLFLLAISPIRFRLCAKYVGEERFSYEFFVSYIHPIFLKICYSSESDNTLRIIWKTFKLNQTKESGEVQGESSETVKNADSKTAEPQMEESEYSSQKSEEKSAYQDEDTKKQKENSTVIFDEALEESEYQEERVSLFNKIKRSINKIKKSKPYRFLSDAVLRKKIKSWLGRCLKSTMKVIVFHRLRIWAKVGLNNPAALGKLCGYFSAARSALSLRDRKVDMTLEPLFMKEALEFEVELRGATSIIRAASCFFMAAFTFPYIRTYKVWRRKKMD